MTDVFNFCDRRYIEKKIFLSKCLIRLSQIQSFFMICNVFFRLLGTLKTSVTETLLYQANFFYLFPRKIKAVILQIILVVIVVVIEVISSNQKTYYIQIKIKM
jgi:hypothetical protein